MDLQEMFVRPVKGDPDLFSFRFDFMPEGKALDGDGDVVTVQDNGDLIIEGWAAVFEGQDRQNENFIEGAFQKGIKAFLDGQAALCYHHDTGKLLGNVLELEEVEGKGLRMKARVDAAIAKHPELGVYYEQIKNRSLRALSVGGFFKRKLTEAGMKINGCDFTEISVTPVPIHPGTSFGVVAGKALRETPNLPEGEMRAEDEEMLNFLLDQLDDSVKRIEAAVARRAA